MAFFGLKKKNRVLDLTEKYKKQLDAAAHQKSNLESQTTNVDSGTSGLNFFAGMASATQAARENSEPEFSVSEPEDRKKKLAKRLVDMTSKIEDLSNQIYHLQQRIEVLERKSGMRIE